MNINSLYYLDQLLALYRTRWWLVVLSLYEDIGWQYAMMHSVIVIGYVVYNNGVIMWWVDSMAHCDSRYTWHPHPIINVLITIGIQLFKLQNLWIFFFIHTWVFNLLARSIRACLVSFHNPFCSFKKNKSYKL